MSSSESPFPSDLGLKKPVCVFCGSSPGSLALYANAAKAVGRALAQNNIPLIYGGGRRGLMGIVSAAALEAGGYVHGIIPSSLIDRASEITLGPAPTLKSGEGSGGEVLDGDHGGRMTTEVTQGMHERKLKMANYSTGGFIVLPGGYGTFEEMMEMITWNQLGIHSLPVMVLNIGNFYAPVRALLEGAVTAGFIQSQNLSLVTILDLEHGELGPKASNLEEGITDQWGVVVIKALDEWTPPNAGYGLKWGADKEKGTGKDGEVDQQTTHGSAPEEVDFSLFTTMRYTTDRKRGVKEEMIPLWTNHLRRLREAHAHFSRRDGAVKWGEWPADEVVWTKVKEKLEEQDIGDYRVRLLIHHGGKLEVQALPAPADAGEFQLLPSGAKGKGRPLILDPQITDISNETPQEIDSRMYKTTNRIIYDQASARASTTTPHPEILLHTSSHLLETATSNIAIQSNEGQWITPKLNRETPFLHGVMRRYLLDRGVMREEDLTIEDFEEAKKEGRRVMGFNGLRGVWEAELL